MLRPVPSLLPLLCHRGKALGGNAGQNVALLKLDGERSEALKRLEEYSRDLEDTVRERTSDLVRAKEEADLASRAKSDFSATMSHEIRTPMNGMMGMLELLEATPLN